MSQQDSSSDDSISPSSDRFEGPPERLVKGRHCHHLGHLEAIPINFGGTLRRVSKACVGYSDTEWRILNSNSHGPKNNICFKLPCPGNNWIATIQLLSDSSAELLKLVQASEPKGSKYNYHRYITLTYGERVNESHIFESYLEDEDRERVPEGPEMIPTLQKRLGFDVCAMS